MKAQISPLQTRNTSKRNLIIAAVAGLLVVALGYWLVLSKAAGFFASVSPVSATLTGNATLVADTQTGKAIQFNAPTVTPPTTTPPVSSAWPTSPDAVGLKVATTKTLNGASIDGAAWFKDNGFPGSGSQSDPYVVDRVLFKDKVMLRGSGLTGKWVKFTNSRFQGDPGSPTPGGSAAIFAEDGAPFFIVEDSTIGPDSPISNGSTAKGTNFGIFSYSPFQARRNNIFGANILVGFETRRDETTGVLLENNYIHSVFSTEGDHTDVINGNSHASHVTIRNNYLDGIRSGNSYVANGFGIYDDDEHGDTTGKTGIIEDWTIDHNYIDRAANLIFCTSNTSRFLDPFVVTNNTFGRFGSEGSYFSCRTPSKQSGNISTSNKALTF